MTEQYLHAIQQGCARKLLKMLEYNATVKLKYSGRLKSYAQTVIYTDKTATNNVEIPLRPVALEIINRYHSKGKDIPLKSNKTINKISNSSG